MRVHHIGYLVHDIKDSVRQFESLGYQEISECTHDEERKIQICFMQNEGTVIELVQPDFDCTIIGKQLKRLRNSPYHICYECNNIDKSVKKLEAEGWNMIYPPMAAPAIENRKVAFLFGSDVGLIELVESK